MTMKVIFIIFGDFKGEVLDKVETCRMNTHVTFYIISNS